MMPSVILRTVAKATLPLFLLFAVFLVLRGHHLPGGGFVGGLVAAAGFTLYGLAHRPTEVQGLLGRHPRTFLALGLGIILTSAVLLPMAAQDAFLKGLWIFKDGKGTFGTPLIFDLGVFFTVLGTALTVILTLAEQESSPDDEEGAA